MRSHSYFAVILLTIFSALLTILSFPPYGASIFIWFSLVPWFYSLTRQSTRQMLLSHTIFQIIFFGIGISWMAQVHPICPIAILFPLWFICLLFPLMYHWVARKRTWLLILAGPIFWVAQEYFRSFFYVGFPYLFIGHTQAFDFPTIIQISDITGVYGVSFTIASVNAVITACILAWQNRKAKQEAISVRTGAENIQSRAENIQNGAENIQNNTIITPRICLISSICVIVLVAVVWGYGVWRLQNITYTTGPKIASIQGNIPQTIKDDPRESYPKIMQSYTYWTAQALSQNPDLIVWPETMCPENLEGDLAMTTMFQDICRQTKIPFLIGSHYLDCDFDKQTYRLFNSAYLMDRDGKIQQRYDKIQLVIVGEFIPLRNILPFLPIIIRNVAGYVPDLANGEKRTVFTLQDKQFGAVICYDIAHTEEIQCYRKQGCQFVVNLTNEGWFMETCELEQLLQISIFRAVEHRIGVVRAGNTGITAYIPPTGILDTKQILHVPMTEYWQRLAPYLQQNLSKKKSLAWHHLPECLYRKDSPFISPTQQNWDVLIQDKPYKWKDFAGVLCEPIPLATDSISFYTQYGDLFAMFTLFVMTVTFCVRIFIACKQISQ